MIDEYKKRVIDLYENYSVCNTQLLDIVTEIDELEKKYKKLKEMMESLRQEELDLYDEMAYTMDIDVQDAKLTLFKIVEEYRNGNI
jgi:ABC-type phosphate transport system auxiliary subunit